MFWAGLVLGGVIGWALSYFGFLPIKGGLRFFYTLPPDDLEYDCDNKIITGEIAGSEPFPLVLYGHVWPDSESYTPDEYEPHEDAVLVERGHTGGSFEIRENGANWPGSGDINFCVWALHASEHAEGSTTCNGSGSGSMARARQQQVGSAAPPVHDKGANAYSVKVSNFPSGPLHALNREWLVEHQMHAKKSLQWTNGGDASQTPLVGLRIESLDGGAVICTLKIGSMILEYTLEADRWRPLAENQLFLAAGQGTNPEWPLPDRVTVAPAL